MIHIEIQRDWAKEIQKKKEEKDRVNVILFDDFNENKQAAEILFGNKEKEIHIRETKVNKKNLYGNYA